MMITAVSQDKISEIGEH